MENRLSEAIQQTMSALNVFADDKSRAEIAVFAFQTSHRTLQQQFVSIVILPILRHLAMCHANGIYDARNEASCELAAKLLANVSDAEQHLPFI